MINAKLKFLTAMLIFGSIGVFVRHIHLPSEQIVFIRCIIGGGLLLALSLLTGKFKSGELRRLRAKLPLLILAGLFLGLNWLFLYQAYTYTSVSIATVLYYLAPVIVVALSPLLLKEQLSIDKFISILMALIGLIIIIGINFTSGENFIGIIYGILSALFYAGLMIVNQKFKSVDSLVLTVVQILVATAIMGIYVAYTATTTINIQDMGLPYLLILCVVHTAFACYLYFSSQKQLQAQEVALLSYLDPASAIVFSFVFLGENLSILQFMGVILILAATFVVGKIKKS